MILVTGGAGYIGSHINQLLAQKGYETVVFDNLVYGHREAVKWGILEVGDLADQKRLDRIFKTYKIDVVFHFDEEYERLFGSYRNLHTHPVKGPSDSGQFPLRVYMVFSQWDSAKLSTQDLPPWICPIQAGSALAEYKAGTCLDESGESISEKNGVLAEMTAAYWIWKNAEAVKYKGLCHYRRHFLLGQAEIMALEYSGVDVILTTPRYAPGGVREMFLAETPVKEPVYRMLLQALSECHPEDRAAAETALEGCLYCPNNMVIARSEIYDAYCAWLFPVLFRMMELDKQFHYGHEEDRHIAYAAELLTSCYFSLHKDQYRIWVTDYRFIT